MNWERNENAAAVAMMPTGSASSGSTNPITSPPLPPSAPSSSSCSSSSSCASTPNLLQTPLSSSNGHGHFLERDVASDDHPHFHNGTMRPKKDERSNVHTTTSTKPEMYLLKSLSTSQLLDERSRQQYQQSQHQPRQLHHRYHPQAHQHPRFYQPQQAPQQLQLRSHDEPTPKQKRSYGHQEQLQGSEGEMKMEIHVNRPNIPVDCMDIPGIPSQQSPAGPPRKNSSTSSQGRRRRRTRSKDQPNGTTPRSRRRKLADTDIPVLEDDSLSEFNSAEEAEEENDADDDASDCSRRITQAVDVAELLHRLSTNPELAQYDDETVEDIALLDEKFVPRKSILSSRSYPTLHGTLAWLESKRHGMTSSAGASPANASPSGSTGSASSSRIPMTPPHPSTPTVRYSQSTGQVQEASDNGNSNGTGDLQQQSPPHQTARRVPSHSASGSLAGGSTALKSVKSASLLLTSHSWESGSNFAAASPSPSTPSLTSTAMTTSTTSSGPSSTQFKVELVRAGFLLKQSDVLRAWKRRYFVLMRRCHKVNGKQIALLQYFKHNQFGRVRGEVVLNDNNPKVIIRFLDALQIRRPYCFEVRKGNTFSMICQGRDEDDVTAWVCLLKNLAEMPSDTMITTYEDGTMRSAGSVGINGDGPEECLTSTSILSSSPGSTSGGMSNSGRRSTRRGTQTAASMASRRSIRMVAELRRILHNTQSQEATTCRNFIKGFDFKRGSNPLERIYAFENRMINMIMQTHAERILNQIHRKDERTSSNYSNSSSAGGATPNGTPTEAAAGLGPGSPPNDTTSYGPLSGDTLEAMQEMLQLVRHHVEEAIVLPLQQGIRRYLQRKHMEEEASVNRRLRWLQGKDQTYFNIPLHQVSWKEWRQASQILRESTLFVLPSERLDAVVNCLENIQSTFAEEVSKRSGNTGGSNTGGSSSSSASDVLEMDDLVPIFTYVLANSGVENLYAYKEMISELTFEPTKIMESTSGSAEDTKTSVLLTKSTVMSIFNDALEFISNMSIPAVLEEIFKDQVTLAIEQDWRSVFEFEVEPTYSYGAMVHHVSQRGVSTFGNSVIRNHILVSLNGQNVVLWPYPSIFRLLKSSRPPHRLGFIPSASYFKILTSNKSLWNVALMHACQRGDLASVQMLLSNGADVNYVGYECAGNTPLHVAVSASHFPVVSYLLQHGAKAKVLGEYGRNALHFVGAPCCMPSTDLNSLAGVLSSSVGGGSGKLSLMERVCMIIKKLVNYGVPVEACDAFGNTPLMFLAEKGYLQAIDLLMACKSNLNLSRRNWINGKNALAIAASEGRRDVVEALLDYGADLHVTTLAGETTLHFAAAIACKSVCELLIDRGSNVNARTRNGFTPLMMVASRGRCLAQDQNQNDSMHIDDSSVTETLDFLLQRGANPCLTCTRHRNALYYAALHGGPEVFGHFVKVAGEIMDFEQRDLFGKTIMELVESALPQEKELKERGSLRWGEHEKVFQLLLATTPCSSIDDDEAMAAMHTHCALKPKPMAAATTVSTTSSGVTSSTNLTSGSTASTIVANGPNTEESSAPSANLVHHCCTLLHGLVTEERKDGNYEIVSGSYDAILHGLFQYRQYQVSDVEAFIWCCDVQPACAIVRHLRHVLEGKQDSSPATGTVSKEFRCVRRMVLHALDAIVESLQNKLQVNWELCREVYDLFHTIFVALAVPDESMNGGGGQDSGLCEDDRSCIEWLERFSVLGDFTNSFERRSVERFQRVSHCDQFYGQIGDLVKNVMRRNPWISFFDEDLLNASGFEVITEDMRERLQVAGIWDSQSAKNMVVRPSHSFGSKTQPSTSSGSRSRKNTGNSVSRRKRRPTSSISELPNALWILSVDFRHLSQQITLLQHFFFSRIKVYELLAGKKDAELTPSYERFRLLHNYLSLWIANQILAHEDVEHRALMLSYFIKVAGDCLNSLHNLDGFMAVMNALNDSSIFRLKKTWMRLTPEARELWQECKKLTEKGARALHKLMKEMTLTTPAIPYLGLILQQVVAFKEFPDFLEPEQINFRKIRGLGGLIQLFMPFQKLPYLLPCDKRILEYLCAPLASPDKEACFERSLVVEPRLVAVVKSTQQPGTLANP